MKNLILLFLLLPVLSYGQTLAQNETDAFTGATVRKTFDTTFSEGLHCYGTYQKGKEDSTATVAITLLYIPAGTTSINHGSDILLKLNNDEIVKVSNDAQYQASGSMVGLYFFLSKAQQEKLKSNSVKAIRIYTNDGYNDFNLSGTEQTFIPNICKLFAE